MGESTLGSEDLRWIEAELARREARLVSYETERDRCIASLKEFVICAWRVIEPTTPLIWNWHLDAICDHLQALIEGRLGGFQNLVTNVPPGSAKSTIVSVCTTPWIWLRNPSWRGIFASGAESVTMRDSMKCRDILTSDWYRETFRPTWKFAEDQNAKGYYINTAKGFRRATTAGAKITGERADGIFVDDSNDAQLAFSRAHLDGINRWWDRAAANRLTSMEFGIRCIIQQRLAEEDHTGHVLRTEPDQWARLIIRQEYEQPLERDPDFHPTPLGWIDPRVEPGELMFERRFPRRVIDGEKARLGTQGYASQHQQRPAPLGGSVWLRHWWKYWKPVDSKLPPVQVRLADGTVMEVEAEPVPEKFDEEALSWDMAFKDLKSSDYVAGGHWGRLGANKFLLKQKRAKLSFTDTLAAFREMATASPRAAAKFVEDKANGTAVIDSLKNEIDGIIAIEPEGGKFARASAVSPQIEAGNVYLPHPAIAPWVNDFIEEAAVFPNGRNDDWVDMTSQLLNRWQSHSFGALYRHVMTPDAFYDDATRPMQRPRPEKWVVIHVAPNGPRIYAQFLDDGEIVLLDREYYWDARREGRQKNDLEYADDLIHGCGEWPGLGNDPRFWPGVILHPEAVSFRVLLASRSVWVIDAEEEKDDDVMRVSTMFAQKKLRINRRCLNIRRDLETMVWEDEKHSTSQPDCCRPYVATRVFNWRLGVNS